MVNYSENALPWWLRRLRATLLSIFFWASTTRDISNWIASLFWLTLSLLLSATDQASSPRGYWGFTIASLVRWLWWICFVARRFCRFTRNSRKSSLWSGTCLRAPFAGNFRGCLSDGLGDAWVLIVIWPRSSSIERLVSVGAAQSLKAFLNKNSVDDLPVNSF